MFKLKTCKESILATILAFVLIAASLCPFTITNAEAVETDSFDQLNQAQITEAMGAGWNLGNTMEAFTDYGENEEAWGNPKVTPELFKAVKAAGFSTVRIPITLIQSIGPAPDYKIDENRLNRIKEVVDYAIDAGLFVIVDGVHGDGYHTIKNAWLLITEEDQDAICDKYEKIWSQYAEVFKDYDEHIIFESMNEVFDGNYYDPNPDGKLYSNINRYNQLFVDTIRKSGGNNASRWLLIPGWNTNIDAMTLDYGFQLPTDNYRSDSIPSDEQRIMISAHYYDPYDFTLNNDSSITQWGSIATDSSKVANWGQEDYLDAKMAQMYEVFVSNGYPVVIGEYCATDKSNKDPDNIIYRAYYAKMVSQTCKKYGAIACYWDIGAKGAGGSCIIDRKTYETYSPEILNAIMEGLNADVQPPATIAPSPTMTATGPSANISILYKCTSTDASSGGIRFNVEVVNNDTKPVNLSDVKIRYWYTRDDGKWQSFNCYYAVVGSGNIWGNMVRIPMSKSYDTANFYSEICFGDGAGVLQPGKSTGQIQITLTKYDNSAYNQLDDYSFNGDMTENGENKCITAYVNGNLAFGIEPGGTAPEVSVVPSVEPSESTKPVESVTPSESTEPIESITPSESTKPVESVTPSESTEPVESVTPSESNEPVESVKPSESTEPVESIIPSEDVEGAVPSVSLTTNASGSITQSCIITSVGSKPVELSKLAIRYYYSKAGDKKQNFWCDNAGLQLNVSPYYLNITSDVKGTFYKDYLEITFDSTESIPEGAGILTIGMRFAQEDWSAYTDFTDNGYEVYYNGVKI